MKENEKHLDLELLLFFLFVSIASFGLYIFRHPFVSAVFLNNQSNNLELFMAYLPDLIIYLVFFIPYLAIILSLILVKITRKIKISDNIIIILFFPLISFFTKGMSLLDIYTERSPVMFFLKILKDNFPFFSFMFIGPLLMLVHFIVFSILNNKNKIN